MIVSFIIPAFNAASTMTRCLDSIYCLPIKESEFEVIVVDDCSTDNTVEIVLDYAISHPNLVLLRQKENHRQGAARNRGVAVAKGKFISFVDSDDEVARGLVEATQLAEEHGLDMVAMKYVVMGEDGKREKEKSLPYEKTRLFTGTEMQTKYPYWGTAPWPYIYRKLFLDRVNYPFAEDVLFEDCDFVNVHLFYSKQMAYCDECGYIARYNTMSITHTLSYKHLCDYALLGTRMLRFYESLDNKNTKYAEGILEGGSFNVMKAFRKLPRLNSRREVRAFYDRLDEKCNRNVLLGYRKPAYCWTRWTRFCLKHPSLATSMIGVVMIF